jgi:phage gp36-like protein
MAYATTQDIIDRYGEDLLLVLADRDGDGAADAEVTSRALADADSEIDLHLAKLYDLPLATVPSVLIQVAVDIAIYRMCNNDALVTEEIRTRYKDARSTLRGIAKGETSLGAVPESSGGIASGPAIVKGPPRVFGRGSGGGLR